MKWIFWLVGVFSTIEKLRGRNFSLKRSLEDSDLIKSTTSDTYSESALRGRLVGKKRENYNMEMFVNVHTST